MQKITPLALQDSPMLSQTLTPNRLETLIAECKLLRILKPQLRDHIRRFQGHSPFVVQFNEELYLSLQHVEDNKQREYYYQLIQRFQSGEEVNLLILPQELQRILQPDAIEQPLFWGPLILGGAVGLVIGVMAMAIGMLFWNAAAVTLNVADPEVVTVQVPIIIFVFFAALGWIAASFIAWRRMKNSPKT
jgi:hypothetical protein